MVGVGRLCAAPTVPHASKHTHKAPFQIPSEHHLMLLVAGCSVFFSTCAVCWWASRFMSSDAVHVQYYSPTAGAYLSAGFFSVPPSTRIHRVSGRPLCVLRVFSRPHATLAFL
jgi:hypothetical protein